MNSNAPSIFDRIISGLSYLTAGLVGIVWLIISAIRGKFPPQFVMFHILQSIFVSLCYVLVNYIFWFLVDIVSYIPFINRIVRQLIYYANMPLVLGYSLMQCIIYGVLLYLTVFAFMGLYAYLPWVSDVIKGNFRK